jgi:DNA-binding NarL/FixJ family response regulator
VIEVDVKCPCCSNNFVVKFFNELNRNEQAQRDNDNVSIVVLEKLTNRERQIVSFIALSAMRNKEVAFALRTTEQVIKNYLRSIYDKLGIDGRLELAKFVHCHPLMKQELERVKERIESCSLKP